MYFKFNIQTNTFTIMGRNRVTPEEVIKRNKKTRENLLSIENKYKEFIKGNETLENQFKDVLSNEKEKFKLLRKFKKEFIKPKSENKQSTKKPNETLLNQLFTFTDDLKRDANILTPDELEVLKDKIADIIPYIDMFIQDKIEAEIKEKEQEIQKLRDIKDKYLK